MKLEGDEDGIAALKAMHQESPSALKFLVGEAKSNTDMRTTFRAPGGRLFELKVDVRTGNLVVSPKPDAPG